MPLNHSFEHLATMHTDVARCLHAEPNPAANDVRYLYDNLVVSRVDHDLFTLLP
jgi:hypothetical protein